MKKICFVVIIILVTLFGCSSNSIDNNDLDEYSKFDNMLKGLQYSKSINSEIKPVTIISYNTEDLSVVSNKEYYIKENNSIDISLGDDCSFIISLPRNPTVTYSWDMLNLGENSLVELKNISSVDLPFKWNVNNINTPEGVGVTRQNFYFSVLDKGSQSIRFEFRSTAYESFDNFKITININIH